MWFPLWLVVSSWVWVSRFDFEPVWWFVDRRLNFPFVVTLGFRYGLPVFALASIVLLVLGLGVFGDFGFLCFGICGRGERA